MKQREAFGMAVMLMPLCLCSALNAMSREEATVRATYSSVVLASRVNSIMESDGQSAAAELEIRLKDIHQGSIPELLDKLISGEVTVPLEDVLPCVPGTWNFRTAPQVTQHLGSTVHVGSWVPAAAVYGNSSQDRSQWNTTFRHAFQELGWQPKSWVSVTVLVSAHGREREYKSMFLFEPDAADSSAQVRVMDYVLGSSLLSTLMHARLAEDIPALPARTQGPGPARLLESARGTDTCAVDAVTGLCCDAATLQCGVKPKPDAQAH